MTAKHRATLALVKRARGTLKRKPGTPSLIQEWAVYKKQEKELEDRLNQRGSKRR